MKITDQQAHHILIAMYNAVENNPALDEAPVEQISGFAVEFVVNEVARLNDEPKTESKYIFQAHDDYVSFEDDTMHTATINITEDGDTHWAAIAIHAKGKEQAVARRDHVLRALGSQKLPEVSDGHLEDKSAYDPAEADFHIKVKGYLTKRQQGYVMGAYREVAKQKSVQQDRECESCHGSGYAGNDTDHFLCQACNGMGLIKS